MTVVADSKPTVFIVDDDDHLRDALSDLLNSAGICTEEFANAESFLNALDPGRPGCLLLDLRMPGMGGVALQEEMGRLECPLPVIILTGHADVQVAVRCVRAGALSFLEKPVSSDKLVAAIDEALAVNQRTLAEYQARRQARARLAALTDREMEVLNLLVRGLANKMIAEELGISARTVEVHRARVMEKTGVNSLAELVEMVLRLGSDPGLSGAA